MVDTLFRLLERLGVELPSTPGLESDGDSAGRGFLSSLIFPLQERACQAVEGALRVIHTASAAAAQQRTALDATADHLRLLENRGRDIRSTSARARDVLERVRLIALNAGLEGLRLGDPTGKALVTVAEELRALIHRGVEALDEHSNTAEQMDTERIKLQHELVQARSHGSTLADELLRAQGTQHEAKQALAELSTILQASAGANREIASQAGAAATHAKQLAESLDSLLGSREGRSLAARTLAPTLEALGAVSAALRMEREREP